MQDEVSEKTINVAVRVGKLAGGEIKKALEKLITDLNENKSKTPAAGKAPKVEHGKRTLKQLSKQNDGLASVELTNPELRLLHKSMKKHNVDFATVKDGKGKYTLFFKGKDVDSVTHAIKKYTQKLMRRGKGSSIGAALASAKEAAQTLNDQRDKAKNRGKGALDR